jgi:hypothetical protein
MAQREECEGLAGPVAIAGQAKFFPESGARMSATEQTNPGPVSKNSGGCWLEDIENDYRRL